MINVKEYCARMVFQKVFSDLETVEDYGFEYWYELYTHIRENELDELANVKGERTYLASEYEGAYLPDLLEFEFTEIKYLVGEFKRLNVNLETYEE